MKKEMKYKIFSYLIIIGIFILFTMQSMSQFSTVIGVSFNQIYSSFPLMIPSSIIPALVTIGILFFIQHYRSKKYSPLLKKSVSYFYSGLFRIVSYMTVLNALLMWSFYLIFSFGRMFDISFTNGAFMFFVINRLVFSVLTSSIVMIYLKVISSIGVRDEI